MDDILGKIAGLVFLVVGFLMLVVAILILLQIFIYFTPSYQQTHAEWENKVNQCVLNKNSRSDCELIIYKDTQNHSNKYTNTPMFFPIVIR